MANVALQELIDRLGEKDGERLYNAVIDSYTAHVRKHALALKADEPTKAAEVDVLLSVLAAVDADPDKTLIQAVVAEPERRDG